LQTEAGPARDGFETEIDPFAQDVAQTLLAWPAIAADHHQIDGGAGFQRRLHQQCLHELVLVLVLRFRFEYQAHRRIAAGFVAHRIE